MMERVSSPNGVMCMAALPPTIGHAYLIDFALRYLNSVAIGDIGMLEVLLYSRSFEPVPGIERFNALKRHFKEHIDAGRLNIIHIADDNCPQVPADDPEDFWGNWRKRIRDVSHNRDGDILFASETYGIELAKILKCEFIPCNAKREVIRTSGTKVRKEPLNYFAEILPGMQPYFRKTITLFGQESTGKTTLSRILSSTNDGYMVPEWAREYLEMTGADITEEKMLTITHGQYASQMTVKSLRNRPFIFQDTDLLTTIGFYLTWNGVIPAITEKLFQRTKSDLYIVMNDGIPFEPDVLRYGGDRRETDKQFWIDLLERYNCRYHVLENINMADQVEEIRQKSIDLFNETANMASFIRT